MGCRVRAVGSRVRPGSPGARNVEAEMESPTAGWWKCLVPDRQPTLCAQRLRNSLRMDGSPTRSVRPLSYGLRPASVQIVRLLAESTSSGSRCAWGEENEPGEVDRPRRAVERRLYKATHRVDRKNVEPAVTDERR